MCHILPLCSVSTFNMVCIAEFHESSGGSTKDLTKKYFAELDQGTVMELYNIYKVDFEMFNYTTDEYL